MAIWMGEGVPVPLEDDLPPEILLVDNEPDLNKDLASAPQNYSRGLQAKPLHWHSDNSYREVPPRGSLFYMHVAPEAGGVTHFLNMYDAYNDLPGDLIAVIEGRWSKQDRTLNSADTIQPGRTPPTDVSMADNVAHPLARIHPATGRIALYLGRRQYQYICGHSVKDSETLLDRLFEAARAYGTRSVGLAGGVSANSRLRADAAGRGAAHDVPVFVPSLALSTDNAAMIAAAGLRRQRAGLVGALDLNADAALAL